MADEILDFYNRELAFFRQQAAAFARKHPKIAGRLQLDERIEDPHVSRLIEAFAYLNARVRLKIEDEFPELCQALLNVLYPEFLAPYPSAAIVQFELQRSQVELTGGHKVPARTRLNTPEVDGEPCRFQTCYPVELWPFSLAAGKVETPPFSLPPTLLSNDARGIVRLELKMYSDRVKFNQLGMQHLRVFLNGDSRYVYDLYELILNNTLGVLFASSDKDTKPVTLTPDCIRPVGFELDQSLIPYSANSRLGYHLLTEFFVFPQKFLFFDLHLSPQVLSQAGRESSLCIYILLDQMNPLLQNLPDTTFQLGATPAINLFRQKCEPIRISSTKSEFRVVPDARRPLANEVHTVKRVTITSPNRETIEVTPFYSTRHRTGQLDSCYWVISRRAASANVTSQTATEDLGTEVFITLVGLDSDNQALEFNNWVMDVEVACLNRDYPYRLPQQVRITPESGSSMVESRCLVHPSATVRPETKDDTHWRLISHLSLNHLSLTDPNNNTESLKEILRLYNFARQRSVDAMIDGVSGIRTRRIVSRVGGAISSGFCKGTEIELILNEEKFSGGGHYLFAAVLDRFFALYASINSFTKTVLKTQQQEHPICSWPPRAGETDHV